MSTKDKEVIARFERGGKRFEAIVYANKAWLFKEGKINNIRDVLVGDIIYYDARKGLKASTEDLRKTFGTDDVYKIAAEIIRRGELQVTARQRRELIEAKRRQIIEFLSRNSIDPRTGLPHPPTRIELALEQARVGIDPFKPVEYQVQEILKKIQRILPLKLARARLGVKIPPQYVGKAYGVLMKIGRVLRSTYQSDGSLIMEIEIPAGLQETVIEKVNALTSGRGEVKVISKEYI